MKDILAWIGIVTVAVICIKILWAIWEGVLDARSTRRIFYEHRDNMIKRVTAIEAWINDKDRK
jgi:dolichyl-phosphate-mannose--protein O-mannosyl transferase